MWHSDKYYWDDFFFLAILFVYKQTHIESPEVGWVSQIMGFLTSPNDFVLGVSVAPQYPSCQDSQPPQILESLPLGCGGDAGGAAPAVAAVAAVGWTQPQCHPARPSGAQRGGSDGTPGDAAAMAPAYREGLWGDGEREEHRDTRCLWDP